MEINAPDLLQATGQTDCHLTSLDGLEGRFHPSLTADLQALCAAAAEAGFELAVASSFRSFDRQFAIWQGKASGLRPLLAENGQPLDAASLSPEALLWAIARWSALPGASRHHWGTDLDVYDRAALADGYQLQLVPDEYREDGPFARFSSWLDQRIAAGTSFGFFRPYAVDRGGIAPEPWHLSYWPAAHLFQQFMTPENLLPLWRERELPLLEQVERNLQPLFERYIGGYRHDE